MEWVSLSRNYWFEVGQFNFLGLLTFLTCSIMGICKQYTKYNSNVSDFDAGLATAWRYQKTS